MRRFCSWVVLAACSVVFFWLQRFAWTLLVKISGEVLHLNPTTMVIVFCIELIGFAVLSIFALVPLIQMLAQIICRSKKGLRYKVLGGVFAAYYSIVGIITLIASTSGLVQPQNIYGAKFMTVANFLTMILYGVMMFATAKGRVADDGPPETKKERLERKLATLDQKEKAKAEREQTAKEFVERVTTSEEQKYAEYIFENSHGALSYDDAVRISELVVYGASEGRTAAVRKFNILAKQFVQEYAGGAALSKITLAAQILQTNNVLSADEAEELLEIYKNDIMMS